MKRPRSIKRTLLTLGLFILGGAVVNVAVAWGFALWNWSSYPRPISSPADEEGRKLWQALAPAQWPHDEVVSACVKSIGCTRRYAWNEKTDSAVNDFRFGWPVRSTFSTAVRSGSQTSATFSWRVPASAHLLKIRQGEVIPLGPLWPGFAINTIFYAGILWMLFTAPGFVRRRIRVMRNLCPACKYPVGTSPFCTECGIPVKTLAS